MGKFDYENPKCPKCGAVSGDTWSQCDGVCPMEGSPHFIKDCDLKVSITITFANAAQRESWLVDNKLIPASIPFWQTGRFSSLRTAFDRRGGERNLNFVYQQSDLSLVDDGK